MATNNSGDQTFANNSDGFTIGGGVTGRTLGVTGGNISMTGGGGATITFPTSSDTLVGRATTDTLTNKTLTGAIGSSPLINEPSIVLSTDYSASGRFVNTTVSGGTVTYSSVGITLSTSAASGSSQRNLWTFTLDNANFNVWGNNPKFSVAASLNCTATHVGQYYAGLGLVPVGATGHSFAGNHIGFKIVGSGSSTSVFGTVADGTTETATSALTTMNQNDVILLKAIVTGSTNVAFYYNKNFSGWSGATNITTHIPTSSGGSPYFQQSVSNGATANDWNIISGQANITY